MTRLARLLTRTLVAFAMAITLTGTASASVVHGKTIGPRQEKYVSKNDYCVRSDDFGSSTWLYNKGERGFKVTKSTANGPRVSAFPNIFRGWQWGIGTKGAWPIKVSRDGAPRADLTVTNTWKGTYNSALEMWFSTYPNRTTQANGAELMIWLSHPGAAAGGGTVRIDGTNWHVNSWIARRHGVSWRLIIFVRATQTSSVKGLWLNPFVRIAESRRWVKPSWYWTGIDAGFEIWRGGKGLGIRNFNVNS